jgi:hypothetical protein
MSGGLTVKSYLEDAMAVAPSMGGCQPDASVRGRAKAGGLTEFSGSYAPAECELGMLGGSEYYRAYRESELARMAPDVLARSVRSTWDDGFISLITPDKPAPVSLAGYDVFGPQSFTTSTRNMTLDLRGEAAYAPNLSGELPVGASVSSLAMGAAVNFSDCSQGCGCLENPAGIQLPGTVGGNGGGGAVSAGGYREDPRGRRARCEDACAMASRNASEKIACSRECSQDVPMSNRLAMAGSNEDLEQDCITSCLATGGPGNRDCVTTCQKMFSGRGSKVSNVHPSGFFTPRQIRPASFLRPYQS